MMQTPALRANRRNCDSPRFYDTPMVPSRVCPAACMPRPWPVDRSLVRQARFSLGLLISGDIFWSSKRRENLEVRDAQRRIDLTQAGHCLACLLRSSGITSSARASNEGGTAVRCSSRARSAKDPNSSVNFLRSENGNYGTGNKPGFPPRSGLIRPNFLSALSKACWRSVGARRR
jgi:hypothetical protein